MTLWKHATRNAGQQSALDTIPHGAGYECGGCWRSDRGASIARTRNHLPEGRLLRVRGGPRSHLRELIRLPSPVLAPGCYDALSARLVKQAGFPDPARVVENRRRTRDRDYSRPRGRVPGLPWANARSVTIGGQ